MFLYENLADFPIEWKPSIKRSPVATGHAVGLQLADDGKQVAIRLGLSAPAVHQYVSALYRKFGVSSRGELLARFIRRYARWKSHTLARKNNSLRACPVS